MTRTRMNSRSRITVEHVPSCASAYTLTLIPLPGFQPRPDLAAFLKRLARPYKLDYVGLKCIDVRQTTAASPVSPTREPLTTTHRAGKSSNPARCNCGAAMCGDVSGAESPMGRLGKAQKKRLYVL